MYLQISTNSINKNDYNEALINTGVLHSNIQDIEVVSSWFFTDYIDDNNLRRDAVLSE